MELVLHRGTSFGRGVKVLPDSVDIPELKKLKDQLGKICALSDSGNSLSDSDLLRADEQCQDVYNKDRDKLQKGDNIGRGETVDNERPSTSREDYNVERKQTENQSSVQRRPVTLKGTNLKRKHHGDNSNEDAQIIEIHSRDSGSVHTIESVVSDNNESVATKIDKSKLQRQELEINPSQHIESVEDEGRSQRQSGSLQRCMLKTSTGEYCLVSIKVDTHDQGCGIIKFYYLSMDK